MFLKQGFMSAPSSSNCSETAFVRVSPRLEPCRPLCRLPHGRFGNGFVFPPLQTKSHCFPIPCRLPRTITRKKNKHVCCLASGGYALSLDGSFDLKIEWLAWPMKITFSANVRGLCPTDASRSPRGLLWTRPVPKYTQIRVDTMARAST